MCINVREHSLGDTALVAPTLPPVSSCSHCHTHHHTALSSCFGVHDQFAVSWDMAPDLRLVYRFREKRPDLSHLIATCRAVLSHPPAIDAPLQSLRQFAGALNACTRLWSYRSGQDLLLVSPAFSQGVCFPSCFFRMPCPLKIFQCMPCVHYLAVHGKTPSARACCECCTVVSQLPPLLICCIISVKAKAVHGTDAWNGIGIQLLHFSNLTSIV